MHEILAHIHQVIAWSSWERELISKAFKLLLLAKGEFWNPQGSICRQVAFLERGKLRVHYLHPSGDEVTCHFVTPGNLISSFTSFLTNTPAGESISAIESSQLWVITKTELEQRR